MPKRSIDDRQRTMLRQAKTAAESRYTVAGRERKVPIRPITLPEIKALDEIEAANREGKRK